MRAPRLHRVTRQLSIVVSLNVNELESFTLLLSSTSPRGDSDASIESDYVVESESSLKQITSAQHVKYELVDSSKVRTDHSR